MPTSPLHSFHATRDFLLDIKAGKIQGHSLLHKFGHNKTFSTTLQDVWVPGGVLTHLQSAETMSVISTDTINDISTGSKARVVTLEGLDGNFNVVTEDVTLLATAVTTTQTFLRVYRMKVKEVGAYGATNSGTITATATTASTVQNSIDIGAGQSGTSHYTVPLGITAYILNITATVDAKKDVDLHFNVREGADIITAPFKPSRQIHHWEGITSTDERVYANYIMSEKTDMWMSGAMVSGTGQVGTNYDILLIQDGY